jgi:UDP-N-acetylmuramate: L-alanyl-gamma-D-glutamyl-meso-diaminopimelate ligase
MDSPPSRRRLDIGDRVRRKRHPPMSTQSGHWESTSARVRSGATDGVASGADAFVIGNVIARQSVDGSDSRCRAPHVSGPQWLYEHVLSGRRVIAVAGTHGKMTTASMLAWIPSTPGCGRAS